MATSNTGHSAIVGYRSTGVRGKELLTYARGIGYGRGWTMGAMRTEMCRIRKTVAKTIEADTAMRSN